MYEIFIILEKVMPVRMSRLNSRGFKAGSFMAQFSSLVMPESALL